MRRNLALRTLLVLTLISAACAGASGGSQTVTQPSDASTATTSPDPSDATSSTGSTVASPSTSVNEGQDEPTRPAIVLATDTPLGPWMPIATDGASVVYADFDDTLTTIDAEGIHRASLADFFVGEWVNVSAVARFGGLYWAFVQGDESTKPGVSSAVVSPDGLNWKRVEIGSSGSAARVPGGFATPDAVQYLGSSGVLDASTDGTTLAVSGWTQTDIGAQPTVWTSTDGESWITDVLPNRSSVAETAPKIAVTPSALLVHTLGSYYLGPDLTWMGPNSEEDASLVGVDVSAIAGGAERFVALASHFGSRPYSFWEFDTGVWSVIAAPGWSGFDKVDDRHPYLLIDSPNGAVAVGAASVGIRSGGAWIALEDLAGDPVAATLEGESVIVVTMVDDSIGLNPVSLSR